MNHEPGSLLFELSSYIELHIHIGLNEKVNQFRVHVGEAHIGRWNVNSKELLSFVIINKNIT